MTKLKDEVALITGGARGIGAAVFLAFSDSDDVVAQTLNVDGGDWMS
jgi:NAD(P)-dependent dehydrogenase (short-subunit alcohol dehydrogenase family)